MQGRQSGRHYDDRPTPARSPARRGLLTTPRIVAVGIAACIAGAATLAIDPADARAVTVPVQLTLSGLASSANPTGGSTVEVHPGDTVTMTAAAIPTAGAPGGLSGGLSGLVGNAADLQVTIMAKSNLPGLNGKSKILYASNDTACGITKNSLTVPSLAKGAYTFHYTVQKISLVSAVGGVLGGSKTTCQPTTITPSKSQLGTLSKNNVKFSDTAGYTGQLIATANPQGGIGVQLPSQSVSLKAGPISTHVTVPGATLTVHNPIPSITKKLGGVVSSVAGKVSSIARGATGKVHLPTFGQPTKAASSVDVRYSPPKLSVPQKVLPHATNVGGVAGYGAAHGNAGGSNGDGGLGSVGPAVTAKPLPSLTRPAGTSATPSTKPVDLATREQLGGKQLPSLLAILAIIALAGVTATYARMVLLRRSK